MRVNSIKNTGHSPVTVELKEGGTVQLPVGCELQGVEVKGPGSIKGEHEAIYDCSDVRESGHGLQRLDG